MSQPFGEHVRVRGQIGVQARAFVRAEVAQKLDEVSLAVVALEGIDGVTHRVGRVKPHRAKTNELRNERAAQHGE